MKLKQHLAAAAMALCCLGLLLPVSATPLEGHLVLGFARTAGVGDEFNVWLGNRLIAENQVFDLQFDRENGSATITADLSGYIAPRGERYGSTRLFDGIAATLSLTYSGLSFDSDPVTGERLVFIGREGMQLSGTLDFDRPLPVPGGLTSINFFEKFFPARDNHPFWSDLATAPFSTFFGASPGEWTEAGIDVGELYLSSWFQSNFAISEYNSGTDTGFFSEYMITADIHATEVPEPSSMLLLGLGILGQSLRKRRAL